jgi:hypothetical protein
MYHETGAGNFQSWQLCSSSQQEYSTPRHLDMSCPQKGLKCVCNNTDCTTVRHFCISLISTISEPSSHQTTYISLFFFFVGFWQWCISIKQIVFLDFIHRLASQEQTMTMEAEPVSKMLCHFFLDTFSLCATACLCVFCIGILAPLCVVFCE